MIPPTKSTEEERSSESVQGANTPRLKYYQKIFTYGGIFNWLMAIGFSVLALAIPSIFGIFGIAEPPTLFFLLSLMALIFTFGIGYYIVGQDITQNRGCVILGIISKLWFFWYCIIFWAIGDLHFIIVPLGFLDAIWASLFLEFLWYQKKHPLEF